jgi:hypothetical protein
VRPPFAPAHRLAVTAVLLPLLLVLLGTSAAAIPPLAQPPENRAAPLVAQLEAALLQGAAEALAPLLAPDRDAAAVARFAAAWLSPGATRVVIKARDSVAMPGGGTRLVLEALIETGRRARLGTWQVDAREEPAGWRIVNLKTLGSIDGLHRLQLDAARRFRATNLRVTAEDLELVLPSGSVFVADVPGGATAVVLIGRGEMIFSPAPEVERGQVQLYAGSPTLRTPFDAAFVRLNPGEFATRFAEAALGPAATDPRQLRTAETVFRESVGNSFSVDLADLSPEFW